MNSRIKELAIEAGLPTALDYHQKRYEKFAELIVKECVEICEDQRAVYTKLCKDVTDFKDKNVYAEGEITAHRIRLSIQKKFGVEE